MIGDVGHRAAIPGLAAEVGHRCEDGRVRRRDPRGGLHRQEGQRRPVVGGQRRTQLHEVGGAHPMRRSAGMPRGPGPIAPDGRALGPEGERLRVVRRPGGGHRPGRRPRPSGRDGRRPPRGRADRAGPAPGGDPQRGGGPADGQDDPRGCRDNECLPRTGRSPGPGPMRDRSITRQGLAGVLRGLGPGVGLAVPSIMPRQASASSPASPGGRPGVGVRDLCHVSIVVASSPARPS